jgi:hypothetical protein
LYVSVLGFKRTKLCPKPKSITLLVSKILNNVLE